ncbi:Vacuolar protein sorting-associated protein 20 [Thecaphora frezii]
MGAAHSKPPKITAHDRALLDLKLQRDRIHQYQKKIQTTLELETTLAQRALAASNKPLALAALRKKKVQQSLLAKTDDQLATLQNLVSTIEFSQIQASVIEGLKQGNTVLKQINDSMRIQDVERILAEGEEARAYQQEIEEMLQAQMSSEEEEEVQREMQALEREFALESQPPVQVPKEPATHLPPAPQTEPVVQQPEAQPERQAAKEPRAEPLMA